MTEPSELNARLLQPIARWLGERKGEQALHAAASAAELTPAELDGTSHWIAVERFEAFLLVARSFVDDDESFQRACTHRLAEGYGAIRFVLWAVSPAAVYQQAIKTFRMVSTFGSAEIVEIGRTKLHTRYRSPRAESRLLCLLRGAQFAALPQLWGLPPAYLREDACIARGDEFCGYHLRWYDKKSWLPSALGLIVGGASFFGIAASGHGSSIGALALPALGAALGYIYETRRTGSANLAVREEVNEALRQLAREETEARREILALHQRQRDWTRLLEEDAAERSATLGKVAERLQRMQEIRDTRILGFSHDLRNPLTVMQAGTEYLRDYADHIGEEGGAILTDFEHSITQMRRLLEDLMKMATQQSSLAQLAPQRLDVPPLTDRLRRRLRALAQGKDIRSSVFKTREAPESIECDLLLFDRVLDNLLTNAAKYTERGSIVVELDGTPEFLTIKISDTGRGIPSEQLERAFTPQGSDRSARANDSYGVGLSVVVQLLGQIGGKLEVMSKPGAGTTFWVHFPILAVSRRPSQPPQIASDRPVEKYREVVRRVVTIRKVRSA